MGGFALLFIVLFISESVGFIRRKIQGSNDDTDDYVDKTDKVGAIPLTTTSTSTPRASTYVSVSAANLLDPHPYDAGFSGAPAQVSEAPRFYSQHRPVVGSRLGSNEMPETMA